MKTAKLVTFTLIMTIGAFAAVIYSSCKKDPCSGVNCQNGGACSGGTCSCPTGYSGNFCENSTIEYTNGTYTPIIITFNGQAYTVSVSGSISIIGAAGSSGTFSAVTSGTATNGTIAWSSATNYFPGSGAAGINVIPLDIPATYFYLEVQNNDPNYSVTSELVNYDISSASTDDDITVAPGTTVGIGYYLGYSNTDIQVNMSSPTSYLFTSLSIPNTSDAEYTIVVP